MSVSGAAWVTRQLFDPPPIDPSLPNGIWYAAPSSLGDASGGWNTICALAGFIQDKPASDEWWTLEHIWEFTGGAVAIPYLTTMFFSLDPFYELSIAIDNYTPLSNLTGNDVAVNAYLVLPAMHLGYPILRQTVTGQVCLIIPNADGETHAAKLWGYIYSKRQVNMIHRRPT